MDSNTVEDFLGKHLVPILFTYIDKHKDVRRNLLVTAFSFSVKGRWFLVTAGHIIKDIQDKIHNEDIDLQATRLIDGLGIDSPHDNTIPFAYDDSIVHYFYDASYGADYAAIYLSPIYVELLIENGVQALDELSWESSPPKIDFCFLFGIPNELIVEEKQKIHFKPLIFNVDLVDEPSPNFRTVDLPMYYGQIQLPNGLEDINGVSGGPLFAFHKDNQGLRYWVIGIQSKWVETDRQIAACPADLLGEALTSFA